jgi:subtilisin family serine protease
VRVRALLLYALCALSLLASLVGPRAIPALAQPAGASLTVVIGGDMLPLGLVAATLTPDQRRAYAAQVTAAQDALAREVALLGGRVVARFSHASSGLAAQLDPAATVQLARRARVRSIRPVGNYEMDLGLSVPGVGAAALQSLGVSGVGASIAVIDSGIDYTHLAFGGPGTPEAYQAAYATNTTIGDDPNFPGPRVRGGFDYVGEAWPGGALAPDPDPIDAFGHGTAVADIAAGSTPGAPGVAPGASLYAFKACSAVSRLCNGLALLQSVDDALDLDNDLATVDPATVIVLALSSAYGQPEDDLVAYVDIAAEMGSVVVASAGGNGDRPYSLGAPGSADGAISVGASVRLTQPQLAISNTISAISSRGPRVADGAIKPDLLAPSDSLAARVGTGNGTQAFGGTSSAVPLVAGAAALLFQKYGATLAPAGYRALLMNNANPFISAAGGVFSGEQSAIGLRGLDGLNAAFRTREPGLAPRVLVRCAGGGGEVLDAAADTFVEKEFPRAVYGNLITMRVRAPEKPPGERFGLLRFPRPACAVASAELQVEVERLIEPPPGGRMLAFGVAGSWSETTTWNSRPALGTQVATATVTGPGVYRLDVTSLAASGGGSSFDVALRSADRLSVIVRSSEVGALPRALVVCADGTPALLDATADTYVREDQPATSFGSMSNFRLSSEVGKRRIALLRFPQVACEVASARLQINAVQVYNNTFGTRGGTVEAAHAPGEWSEGPATTWATRPELGDALGRVAVAAPGFFSIDIGGAFGGTATPAPITAQGAGQLNALAAYQSETLAWQETNADAAITYSETASISFGYQAVTGSFSQTRQVRVRNLGSGQRSYTAGASFRYGDDVGRGVQLRVTPTTLTLPPGGEGTLSLTLEIDAAGLRPWELNSGALGATGSDFTNPLSPSLTLYEYDGFLTIDGGERNSVRLPWQVLPKRAADPRVDTTPRAIPIGSTAAISIANLAPTQAAAVEVFALTELSPNIYSYTVGSAVGENQSPSDLKEVGVRGRAAPNGTALVEFAATVHDFPYRAAQYPVRIDVLVDVNRDGVDDALVFTDDRARNASDGRAAVFVSTASGSEPAFVGFVDRDFNSQNWIIPVPAATLGIAPNAPFDFQVRSVDNIFPPLPGTVVFDRTSRMTFQLDAPAFRPGQLSLQVAPTTTATLSVSADAAGLTASPGQQGILLLYRQAPVGRESDALPLSLP